MLNERARKKEIVIFHPQGNGTYASRIINIKTMLEARGTREDYPVLPGDILYVPQNRASKIQKFLPNANMGAYRKTEASFLLVGRLPAAFSGSAPSSCSPGCLSCWASS